MSPRASLQSLLPPLYQSLLDDFFQVESPKEALADCSACPLLPPKNPLAPESPLVFHKDSKCCTYHPDLVNVLAGAVLADTDPELKDGQERLRVKIRKRAQVSPLGIGALWKEDLEGPRGPHFQFGRSQHRRCPYYQQEEGLCSIWKHRESVCSTWFCKHDLGADGLAFWSRLQDYLEDVENQVSRAALGAIAPELITGAQAAWAKRLSDSNEQSERPLPPQEYAKLWQSWLGREEELYIQCFQWAQKLQAAELDQLLGPIGQDGLEQLKRAYQQLQQNKTPQCLALNPEIEIVHSTDKDHFVRSYAEFDVRRLNKGEYHKLQKTPFEASQWQPEHLNDLYRLRILIDPEASDG